MKKSAFLLILTLITLISANSKAQMPLGEYGGAAAFDPEMNRYLSIYLYTYEQTDPLTIITEFKGQLVNADGTKSGDAFAIPEEQDNALDNDVCYDPYNRRFLVIWSDYRNGATKEWDIYGRFVNQDGTVAGSQDIVIYTDPGSDKFSQRDPKVAYDSVNRRFLVIWNDNRNGASNQDIYGIILDKDAQAVGSDFNVTSGRSEDQYRPAIAYAPSIQSYLVVWEDDLNFGTTMYDIYGKLIDKDGTPGSLLTIAEEDNSQERPQAAYDSGSDSFMVVYQDTRNKPGYETYVSTFSAGSPPSGSAVSFMVSSGDDSQIRPKIASDATNSRFLVGWLDSRNTSATLKTPSSKAIPASRDLFARFAKSDGTIDDSDTTIFESDDVTEIFYITNNFNCDNHLFSHSSYNTTDMDYALGYTVYGDACSQAPSKPELLSPKDEATGVGTTVTFDWNESTDPDGDDLTYSVLYCEDENFAGCEGKSAGESAKIYQSAGLSGISFLLAAMLILGLSIRRKQVFTLMAGFVLLATSVTIISCSGSDATSYKATDLKASTTYYWKVIASDSKGGITHSDTWSFTTK